MFKSSFKRITLWIVFHSFLSVSNHIFITFMGYHAAGTRQFDTRFTSVQNSSSIILQNTFMYEDIWSFTVVVFVFVWNVLRIVRTIVSFLVTLIHKHRKKVVETNSKPQQQTRRNTTIKWNEIKKKHKKKHDKTRTHFYLIFSIKTQLLKEFRHLIIPLFFYSLNFLKKRKETPKWHERIAIANICDERRATDVEILC